MCGNKATGKLHIKVKIKATDAEATDMPLPLCYSCRERIDSDHKWVFVAFEQIDDRKKERKSMYMYVGMFIR